MQSVNFSYNPIVLTSFSHQLFLALLLCVWILSCAKRKLTLVLLNPDIPFLCKQCRSRSGSALDQLASSEANWSGSALFAINYVILYQQSGSSNLVGWKLEVGVASYLFSRTKVKNGPGHSITYKIACALSKASDQPALMHKLISLRSLPKDFLILATHRVPCKDWSDFPHI